MQATRPNILPLMLVVSLAALPGCRTGDSRSAGVMEGMPLLTSIAQDEDSSRRVEAQARYASGLAYDLNREPAKAIEEYVLSVKAEPSNETLALEVSRRLILEKQLEKALEVIEWVADTPDASENVFAQLGVLYGELGRYDDAVKANRKAIKMAPESLLSYHNLYTVYVQQGNKAKAVAVLHEAAGQPSENASFWLDLAELYANFYRSHPDDHAMVEAEMRQCLERADELGVSDNQRIRLADGLALAGETERAVSLLLSLLEEYEENPVRKNAVRQKLLSVYVSTDDTEGAIAQLESLVSDYPTNAQANYLLASYAMENGQTEKAIDYFQKTIQLDPSIEQAHYALAGLYLDNDRAGEAVAVLESARNRFPESFMLEYYTAIGLGMLEAHEAAMEHYTKAEIIGRADERVNLNHLFYFGFGAQQERAGLYEPAAATFKRCLDLKSDFAPALNYLGYMWADQGVELERARDYIKQAVEQEPENAAYLDSLAWVYFKLEQPNIALAHMQDAIRFSADEEPDPILYDHLGDIQFAVGNADAAREAWEKSLELKEDDAVRAKLDQLNNPGTLE